MKQLDIRVPMGIMFTLLGVVLAGYGLLSIGSPAYARSLDINVNLWWGGVILIFGVALLALAWHAGRSHGRRQNPPAPLGPEPLRPVAV